MSNRGKRSTHGNQQQTDHQMVFDLCGARDLPDDEVERKLVQLLNQANFNFHQRDRAGNTLLHTAALAYKFQKPHAAKVFNFFASKLISKSFDYNALNRKGFSVLHILAEVSPPAGKKHLAHEFIKGRFSLEVDLLSKKGSSALYYAVKSNNLTLVKELMEFKLADPLAGRQGFDLLTGIQEKIKNLCALNRQLSTSVNRCAGTRVSEQLRAIVAQVNSLRGFVTMVSVQRGYQTTVAAKLIAQSMRTGGIFNELPLELSQKIAAEAGVEKVKLFVSTAGGKRMQVVGRARDDIAVEIINPDTVVSREEQPDEVTHPPSLLRGI